MLERNVLFERAWMLLSPSTQAEMKEQALVYFETYCDEATIWVNEMGEPIVKETFLYKHRFANGAGVTFFNHDYVVVSFQEVIIATEDVWQMPLRKEHRYVVRSRIKL